MRFLAIGIVVGIATQSSALAAGPLQCETLKNRVAAQENPAHAAALRIVSKEDVGTAKVLGSCGGNTMRLILPRDAPMGAVVATGARAVGVHENVGPLTCVPGPRNSVTSKTPGCDGSTTGDDVLGAIATIGGLIGADAVGAAAKILDRSGWGTSRHQDFAECRLVCSYIPTGIPYTDSNVTMWFGHGLQIQGAMGKSDEDRWGPGTEGYWRVDKGFRVLGTVGDNQIVCKQARNWAGHSQLFQLHVSYSIGGASTKLPPETSREIVACTNGMAAPR